MAVRLTIVGIRWTVSVQAHVFPDDTGNESAASDRIVEKCSHAGLDRGTNAGVGGGRERVQVGGPDVNARDLIAVALDEPSKRREASLGPKTLTRAARDLHRNRRVSLSSRRCGEFSPMPSVPSTPETIGV